MSAGGLTLDTDALIAAERSDLLMWSLHLAAVKRGRIPMVLAGVLSEAWRGGPQHQMSRLRKGCEVEDLNEAKARRLGVFVAQFGLVDTVDLAAVDGASPMSDLSSEHLVHWSSQSFKAILASGARRWIRTIELRRKRAVF